MRFAIASILLLGGCSLLLDRRYYSASALVVVTTTTTQHIRRRTTTATAATTARLYATTDAAGTAAASFVVVESSRGEEGTTATEGGGGGDDDDERRIVEFGTGTTMTERMFRKVDDDDGGDENQAGGAGGGASTLDAFLRAESNWGRVKSFEPFVYDPKLLLSPSGEPGGGAPPPPPRRFVTDDGASGNPTCWSKLRDVSSGTAQIDYDVVVCGGTLGIFFAAYLQLRGHSVCVIEAGKLRGREQEWNISMDELDELVKLGVLDEDDVDAVITTEFPACRSGFKNREVTPLGGGYLENDIGYECATPGVLNLGVAPATLLERVSQKFTSVGGTILERTPLRGVCVSESIGSALDLGGSLPPLTARLVLDCMGNASPISSQQRHGVKPDGICAVVGSCAGGYDPATNKYGDIIYTNTPTITRDDGRGSNQYFWEAFPVGIGRNGVISTDVKTTYMFTYMDAHPDRLSLFDLMEDYWKLLPVYQPSIVDPETDLDVKRILFAYFPTYRDAPLKPSFSRVLAVGDASGIQSPLSFGGFGALTRHLGRVGGAISEALDAGCLHKDDLGNINPYQPNLSAAWMFQKAMSMKMGSRPNPEFVNRLLATNFQVMNDMGYRTIKPFLQDVVRMDGLAGSLARSFVADPTFMPQIVATVGLPELIEWLGHVGNMAAYTVFDAAVSPVISPFVDRIENPREKFSWRRRMEGKEMLCTPLQISTCV
jgi:hypothetical protein